MNIFTKPIKAKLLANGALPDERKADLKPVLKVFTPDAGATWLFTELDAVNGQLFGLCDLGLGEPELGYVDLDELLTLRGRLGLPVERDRYFTASKSLAEYAAEARANRRISA